MASMGMIVSRSVELLPADDVSTESAHTTRRKEFSPHKKRESFDAARKNGNFSVVGEKGKGGARAARGGAERPRAPPEAAPEARRCAGGAYILRETTGSDFSTQIASSTQQRVTHGMRRFSMILSIQDDFLGKKHL